LTPIIKCDIIIDMLQNSKESVLFFVIFNQNLLSFEILDIFSLSREKETITTVKKNCHILSYRLEGSTEICFKNKKHTVSKDDLLFIPVASSYSQITSGEELIVIHLNINNYVDTNMSIINCSKNPEIREYFLLLLKLWNTSPTKPPAYALGQSTSILKTASYKRWNIKEDARAIPKEWPHWYAV